jgi:hypothetical protein
MTLSITCPPSYKLRIEGRSILSMHIPEDGGKLTTSNSVTCYSFTQEIYNFSSPISIALLILGTPGQECLFSYPPVRPILYRGDSTPATAGKYTGVSIVPYPACSDHGNFLPGGRNQEKQRLPPQPLLPTHKEGITLYSAIVP